MNTALKKTITAALVFAFLVLMYLAIKSNFEQVEETRWRPLTGEARNNPLYASKLFLRRMGIPTEMVDSVQDLSELPDTDTVILISATRDSLRAPQVSRLLTWVKNGGHLVVKGVGSWNIFNDGKPIVDESNIRETEDEIIYYEDEDEFAEESDGDAIQSFIGVALEQGVEFHEEKSAPIQLNGSKRPLLLGADYYRAIGLAANNDGSGLEQIAVNGRNVMVRQQVDEGLITVVSSLEFINNYKLGEFDHAEILWQIIRGKPATLNQSSLLMPEAVWLIHSDETANLFQLIWKHFWAFVISLILLFLIWALRVSRRFGPTIEKEDDDRRDLMEHIKASGAYYWKQKDFTVLLESTRSATQQRLSKRIPGWHALEQPEQLTLLSKRLALSEQQLYNSLYSELGGSPHEFTETIKQLEHIRTRI